MRSTFALIGLVLAATLVAAQCPAAPAVDPLMPSMCGGFVKCQTSYCSCVGSSTNSPTCTAATTTSCATLQACLLTFNFCVGDLAGARLNSSDSCFQFGTVLHQAQLSASASTYAGSALQTSCHRNSCLRLNGTFQTCSLGTNFSTVCAAPSVGPTSAPGVTLAPAIRAILRLSGSDWGQLLSDPSKRAQLFSALTVDLAGLLGIAASFITIISLTLGSLIVEFTVGAGSGKTIDQLSSSVSAAAASTTWLTSTKSAYATVSTETITVQSAGVTATAAPTTTTTSPGGNTPSSSAPATTFVIAALLALAAIVA